MITRVNHRDVVLESFKMNHSLMYAIKSLSGDSENQIVAYFYELGIQLFNDCISRKKLPLRCNRSIKSFYKDTKVQVKFEIWSTYFNSSYSRTIDLRMAINYPKQNLELSGDQVTAMLEETGLGLSDAQVTVVDKPEEKFYRCQRKNQA